MRTAVADTSIAAYRLHFVKLGRQQAQIVAYLARHCHRDHTRLELAEALGMRLSSVCGRVAELLAQQTISEGPRRACSCSGIAAHPVRLAPTQAEMFVA